MEIEKNLLPTEKEINFLIERKEIALKELGSGSFPTATKFIKDRIKELKELKKKIK